MPPKHRHKPTASVNEASPERFFKKQLAGEEGPSLASMRTVFHYAMEVQDQRPWDILEEHDLVMFAHPATQEPCFCSVQGALGEAYVVQVLIGAAGYSWFQELHQRPEPPQTLGDYMSGQYSVYVHFLESRSLTSLDRQVLKTLNHPARKGRMPTFQTVRPGYCPWTPTEGEIQVLIQGLKTVLAMYAAIREWPHVNFWAQGDTLPFVSLGVDGATFARQAPPSAPPPAAPAPLDHDKIQAIRKQRLLRSTTIVELDHFYGDSLIGKKEERKACLRVAMAADAATAVLFPPTLGSPHEATGTMLNKVVFDVIAASRSIPTEIHVRSHQFQILLQPLATALGFKVKIRESLPALDFAKDSLLEFMDR